jgi:heme exporter protein C
MLAALYLIFVWVSTEATMGIIQRIFYFHVPAAAVSFWAIFVGGIASLLYLKTRDYKYDEIAAAANESVLVFQAINILLGSIWGDAFGASGGLGTHGSRPHLFCS